ncbi:hypothetical protein DFR58_101183 [Anaerobacterium chartisolvens]|uniref:DUF1540 domain-containing protein n=1 Tax=Anaerobacterium chartisolvens TaxID=1297424 RepID=A0A369BHE5_9FIRM|nr:hydroxymyristoyl-ACP dehydratase [Anaerobacterium chartisolvens]RCX20979.1 hypothetical protein DFR58_101183 [Anaerobacterium chartisolvens]
MTTINCSSNCIHQVDGKCTMENTATNLVSISSDCVYFQPRKAKKTHIQK